MKKIVLFLNQFFCTIEYAKEDTESYTTECVYCENTIRII